MRRSAYAWSFGWVATVLCSYAGRTADAATCTLEMKRMSDGGRRGISYSSPEEESVFRMSSSQHFWMDTSVERQDEQAKAFPRIVKKEPAEYAGEHPFRGVVRFGSNEYAFVFDATNLKKKGYDRLYFDANHNGDLTDDKMIEARATGWGNTSSREFPRVDLTIDVEGTPVEYAFFASIYAYGDNDDRRYASASFSPGAYREGKLEMDGKTRRVVLLDFNANGRFDDVFRLDLKGERDGPLYPSYGDMLLVDPKFKPNTRYWDFAANDYYQYVSSMITIGERFYSVKISPAGDKVTIEPSTAPLGSIRNPNAPFQAVLYSEALGFLKVRSDGPTATVPEGDWMLSSYTIDRTPQPKPTTQTTDDNTKEEKPKRSGSLLSLIFGSSDDGESEPPMPRQTLVSAMATKECKSVKVVKGQATDMPFGPPYRPKVTERGWSSGNERVVRLDMSLVGVAGEQCTDLMVKGKRPDDPRFTIALPDGEIVERGKFEYG